MDICCARCGTIAQPAGHEDARAFYQCEKCNRVWMVHLAVATSGRTDTPPTRILVVDDENPLLGLIEMWLEDEGYEVATASSGRQALELAAAHQPDIVLLDLILPPPNGFVLCEILRRRRNPPEIVVMTGLTDPLRVHEAETAGIFALLHKPLTQESVLEAVARAQRFRWRSAPRVSVS